MLIFVFDPHKNSTPWPYVIKSTMPIRHFNVNYKMYPSIRDTKLKMSVNT